MDVLPIPKKKYNDSLSSFPFAVCLQDLGVKNWLLFHVFILF